MKRKLDANRSRRPGNEICYYFDWELCWHNYCLMLNNIIMTLDCLVKNLSSNRYETQFGCIQRTKVKDQVISYFIFFKCFGSFFLEKKNSISDFQFLINFIMTTECMSCIFTLDSFANSIFLVDSEQILSNKVSNRRQCSISSPLSCMRIMGRTSSS